MRVTSHDLPRPRPVRERVTRAPHLSHMAPAATPMRLASHPLGSSRLGAASIQAGQATVPRLATTRATRKRATPRRAAAGSNGTVAQADRAGQGDSSSPGGVPTGGRGRTTTGPDAYTSFDSQLKASMQAASTLAAEVSALAAKAGQRVNNGAAVARPVTFGAQQTSSGAPPCPAPAVFCVRRTCLTQDNLCDHPTRWPA
jgi:hypothetical protein